MMNTEMYARNGGKALPKGSLNVVKVINFVDEKGQPVTMGQGPAASFTKAAYVDPTTGTVADIVNALVTAGLMASA